MAAISAHPEITQIPAQMRFQGHIKVSAVEICKYLTCFGWWTRGTIETGASSVTLNELVRLIGLDSSLSAPWLRSRSSISNSSWRIQPISIFTKLPLFGEPL
jgi:hypothetical protein